MSNAKSCTPVPLRLNSEGNVEKSKLFQDLLDYSGGDRTFAKDKWGYTRNEDFINSYRNQLEFDESGEPTMRSLLAVLKTSVEDSKVINMLNKQIKAGTYSWEEALEKLRAFNQNKQWSKEYTLSMVYKNGKYEVSVVKRSPATEITLQNTVANQTVQQKLISLLQKYGVAVDFLTEGKSQYSTENALRSADGLYHLIQIVQGKTDVTSEVAEEAGHFAVAALGNSPLVQRLEQLLTPEVQRQALGEEYDNKYLGRDARREVAGDLVGKALIKRMGNSAWGRLVNRIVDLAKRVFYKMKADEVSMMRLDAEKIANQIARGFMSESFEGSLENALNTEETLYSAEYSEPVKVYKNVLVQLQTAANTLRATNSIWADRLSVIMAKMQFDREAKINTNVGAFADSTALEGIAEAMDMLVDVMSNELPELLNSVDFNNTFDFATNMARNGHSLREAHIVTAACVNISKLIADTSSKINYDSIINYKDSVTGEKISRSIATLQQSLSKFTSKQGIGGFYNQLLEKEKAFFIRFLEDSYGKKYIERATRVVFDQKLAKEQGRWFVAKRQGRQYSFDELLDTLEQDINFFDKFLGAMADSGDIIGEIVDKTMKQANKEADDLTNKIWDDLRVIEEDARKAGIKDPEIIYERDSNGKLTGNLIDQLKWGVWEKDYQDFMRAEKKKFLEEHANDLDYINKAELEKAFMWQAYFEPLRKAWHKSHSTLRPNEGWVPSDKEYHNDEYDKLAAKNPAAIKLLQEIMAIKEVLDSMIDHSMPTHRAPQFKGTFMNKVRNKGSRLNPKNYGAAWWDATKDAFIIDEEDAAMYGSTLTYNEPEEDMFANQVAFEKEKINRIPLFGINPLKNMDMLSTDIYASMLSYAGMATRYAASRQIVDTVEIGKEILRGRKVGGSKTEAEREKTSWAFTRYCKYLDKQVYGVGNKPIVVGKVVLNKIASGLSSLASKVFLGGNIFGGLVNLGTGKIEIFKEGIAAEYFDLADIAAAKKYYYSRIPATILQLGKVAKDDELSLIMRHFNMLNNSREKQRQYSTYKSRVKHIYDESLLFPYTMGDHYMQSIPYLSLMHHQNLLAEDGSKAGNLLQLYQKAAAKFTDSSGRTKTSKKVNTIELDGPYFKTEEDRQTYLTLKNIMQTIDAASGSGPFGSVLNFTQEQAEFLADKGWANMDANALRKLVTREMQNVQWNSDDESALMDKAREVDDRLHGIYNEQDKTELHQEIWGAMLLAMRGYALGMIQRRFGIGKYSVVLGGETEGNLLTFAKMIAAIGMDNWGFGKSIATIVWPWTKNARARMEAAGFSTNQYRNVRRTWFDFAGIILLALLKALCADDDDDKETDEDLKEIEDMLKKEGYTKEEIEMITGNSHKAEEISLLGVGYYFASRLLREQSAYNFVGTFIDEWSNITSLVPVGVSVTNSIWDIAYNMGGDLFYDYQSIDPEKYELLKGMGYPKKYIDEIKKADKEALKEAAGRHFFYQSDASDGSYKKGDAKWKRKLKLMSTVPLPIYTNGEWDLYWNYWGKTERVLYHPYEAAKSYEYGRKVRN